MCYIALAVASLLLWLKVEFYIVDTLGSKGYYKNYSNTFRMFAVAVSVLYIVYFTDYNNIDMIVF